MFNKDLITLLSENDFRIDSEGRLMVYDDWGGTQDGNTENFSDTFLLNRNCPNFNE